MNKIPSLFLLLLFFGSCSQNNSRQETYNAKTDSLSAQFEKLKEKYRPGLGEIMGGIQMHHAKLWFAAMNDNWKLADYEIAEIKERLEEAAEIENNRPEVKMISMIYPSIDSVINAIRSKKIIPFKNSFQLLTNTCNDCHIANHFEFNIITIPTTIPVSNQQFKIKQ